MLRTLLLVAPFVSVFSLPIVAAAQFGWMRAQLVPCHPTLSGTTVIGNCEFCDLFILLHNIFNFLAFQLTPLLAVIAFVAGGLLLMFVGTDEKLRELAKGILRAAVIGVIIVLLSWVVINTTINVLSGLGVGEESAGQPAGFPWPWNEPNCGGRNNTPTECREACTDASGNFDQSCYDTCLSG